jgi:hypothetical protein
LINHVTLRIKVKKKYSKRIWQFNAREGIWNPEVFRSKEFNFFSLCRGICENVFHFFTLTCRKPPNSFWKLQPLSNKTNWIFLKTTNKRYYLWNVSFETVSRNKPTIKRSNFEQIYHAWEGYLRKIPVERRTIFRTEWRGKFSLKTGIFRKYPSQTWYICLITPNII